MVALAPLESPTLKFPMTELLVRIRAEYMEMPGLKLTTPQARRLWGLDCATCDAALAALVNATFLSRTLEGLFVMATPRADQKPRSCWGTTDAFAPVGARARSPVTSGARQEISSGDVLPPRREPGAQVDSTSTRTELTVSSAGSLWRRKNVGRIRRTWLSSGAHPAATMKILVKSDRA
jgi:hypothetical protein